MVKKSNSVCVCVCVHVHAHAHTCVCIHREIKDGCTGQGGEKTYTQGSLIVSGYISMSRNWGQVPHAFGHMTGSWLICKQTLSSHFV